MISGYLIASSYEKYGKDHVFKFIIKKLLRILPLYYAVVTWFYITDTFLFHFYVIDETGVGWKRYFLFLNGFIQPGQDPYGYWSNLGASWTIPCFAFAYLFVPVYLHLMNKLRGGYYLHLTITIIFTLIYIYQIPIIVNFTHHYFDACFQLCFFLWGVTVFYGIMAHKDNDLIILNVIFLIVIQIYGLTDYPIIYTFAFSIILIETFGKTIKNHAIKSIIDTIDKYSFCIYMVQAIPLQQICDYYYWEHGERLNSAFTVLVVIGVTAFLAVVFYCIIEKPRKKLLDQLLNRKTVKSCADQ